MLRILIELALAMTSPTLDSAPVWAAATSTAPAHHVRASRYGGARDGKGGHGLACAPDHVITERDLVVASRTLRCGTVLLITRGGRSTLGVVMDRGPYGRHPDGSFRGGLDLSPEVVRRLSTPGQRGWGRQVVRYQIISVPRRPMRLRARTVR